MTRHSLGIMFILCVIAWAVVRGCGPDDALAMPDPPRPPQHQGAVRQLATPVNYSTSSNSSPAQPITPTATVALPTATDWPTLTPAPTEAPRCAVTVYWRAAAGREVNVYQRPAGTFGRWDWIFTVTGEFPATGIPLGNTFDYLADLPGPTNTPWNTPAPPTETPTPLPTQTPWIVTATPEPTATAPPTASATFSTPLRAVLLPVVVRPRVRR